MLHGGEKLFWIPISIMGKDITICAVGGGSNSRLVKSDAVSLTARHRCDIFSKLVALAPSSENELRQSLHASA